MAVKKQNQDKGNSYHHGDLRPALITAARNLLQKQGIEAVSLRSIASAIGVTHMAPYAHFKGKQELLQAVAASGYDELAANMLKAQKNHPKVRGRLMAYYYGVEYIQFAVVNPNLYRLMLNQIDLEKKIGLESPDREIWVSSQRPFRLLYAAFANERVSKDLAHARALGAWATVHGIASLAIDGHLVLPEGMDVIQLLKTTVSSSVEMG
ncbi:TetR/AcrR family transcriptional regulator [Leptospira congkakensis]|uniref:TetR/AcrR family transcriptional regulator n=1 Tax=Leptospira congkakensis TaxID=2484932 RepID=A0A4Z1A8M8_9LEPT|nr:TetR/AcrR family transcriptional regulator [Leptospira congkakensis]TGL87781.1 TetR/AcrR family transcriptional regulator [Leptospira congkakensis]TGL89603.1 TetR/AcrR family transcriptional regulator [Leptospira congkakensis]TGL95931.1 TetR/AcrR family transcriptional regulator [Leptospira congkakensis]